MHFNGGTVKPDIVQALAATATVALLAGSVSAGVITTSGSAAPGGNIVDSYDQPVAAGAGTTLRYRSTGTDTDAGQTFIVPAGPDVVLSSITFRLGSAGATGSGNLILDLFSYTGSKTSAGFTGLFRDTAAFSSAGLSAGDYVTFNLTTLPLASRTLAAGEYGFLFGALNEDQLNVELAKVRITDSPALDATTESIRRETEFGSSRPGFTVKPNSVRNNEDYIFYVQGSPIPEPLAAGGVLSFGLMLLRRKGR